MLPTGFLGHYFFGSEENKKKVMEARSDQVLELVPDQPKECFRLENNKVRFPFISYFGDHEGKHIVLSLDDENKTLADYASDRLSVTYIPAKDLSDLRSFEDFINFLGSSMEILKNFLRIDHNLVFKQEAIPQELWVILEFVFYQQVRQTTDDFRLSVSVPETVDGPPMVALCLSLREGNHFPVNFAGFLEVITYA